MQPGQLDCTDELQSAVSRAFEKRTPLQIVAGGTKRFHGRVATGETLSVARHAGIVSYEPTELVLTARSGTKLRDVKQVLANNGQHLPFEPPGFGNDATIGGTIACGFSGPRRPWSGAARDHVLGVRCINGRGEVLSFGGQVMKNVAGYDVSRLMTGAMGTLGVLLEISFKVLPRPVCSQTLRFEMDQARALHTMAEWSARPLPLSAMCHDGEFLYVRLSGSESAVVATSKELGGDTEPDGDAFWERLREQATEFFSTQSPLWRLSIPAATPPIKELPKELLVDWGGAQRWLASDVHPENIRSVAEKLGGHATLFRNGDRSGDVFHPLSAGLESIHQRLKQAFDPKGILNPGRMYDGW